MNPEYWCLGYRGDCESVVYTDAGQEAFETCRQLKSELDASESSGEHETTWINKAASVLSLAQDLGLLPDSASNLDFASKGAKDIENFKELLACVPSDVGYSGGTTIGTSADSSDQKENKIGTEPAASEGQ